MSPQEAALFTLQKRKN